MYIESNASGLNSSIVNYGEWQSITFDDIDLSGLYDTGRFNYSVGTTGISDLTTDIVSSFSFDFADYVTLENGKFYQIDAVLLNSDLQFSQTSNFTYGGVFISNSSSQVSFDSPSSVFLYDGESIDCKLSIINTVTLRGKKANDGYYWLGVGKLYTHNIGDISIRYRVCELALTGDDIDSYQNGYNAGYSDGLLDGEASVDTEAIRNEAYQAGYEAGLVAGSDDTLKEDKVLVDTVTNEFTLTGQVINNYSQQYIVEPMLSIANGSLNYTMPVSLGYLFDVGKDYLIDFKRISVVNSNDRVDVELGEYVDHRISNSPAFTLSGPGLYMSSCGELIYSPNQTGDFSLRVSVPAELVLRSTYNEAIENDYAGVYVPSFGYALGKLNWDSTFTYEIDVYEIDIVEEIDYLRDQSNKLSDLNNTQQESLDTMKETQETTKGIFSSIQDFFGSFFQNLIDSVIGLFVPSAEEMSGLFDQLNQFFSDRFGFLYAPFDYMIQLLDVFISSTGDTGLTFPGFSIMGYEVWPDMTYDISEDPLVGQIFQYVRMGTGILLAGWFVMYLQDFFKERFSQG